MMMNGNLRRVPAGRCSGELKRPLRLRAKPDAVDIEDPEAKFKRYGPWFGKNFTLPSIFSEAPRVRVRTNDSRARDDLLEIAMLNERLSGELEVSEKISSVAWCDSDSDPSHLYFIVIKPWEVRNKLEHLKLKGNSHWEAVSDYISKQDVVTTLQVIEDAYRKVEETLSPESRENRSVDQLQSQLETLQLAVSEAQQRLQATQERVEENVNKLKELREEAAALERIRQAVSAPESNAPLAASSSSSSSTSTTSTRSPPSATPIPITPGPSTSYVSRNSKGSRGNLKGHTSRDRALRSSMEAEEALKEFWYPAEFSSKLTKDLMVPFEIFDEPWVLFRDQEGRPSCIKDQCAHRACPLSAGKVEDGQVTCPYHGWQFNGAGHCTKMPSTVHCKNVAVAALPCVEKDGFVWVWPGNGIPSPVPSFTPPPPGFEIHAEIMVDVPVEHGLLMENLLDLAHAPFTHVSTFARGWPVPDAVKFHANQLLSGNWDPYPIEMAFQPPCMVTSLIGLAQPGKIMRGVKAEECEKHLHQLHVCAPSKRGHTRLLYRMSLDFMPWIKYVPMIDRVWKSVAGQVLGEDLVLVLGQQDRLERGGNTWNFPVSYDKIAVRYRRWRNSVADGDLDKAQLLAESVSSMSAGEMFSVDISEESEAEFADETCEI